MIQFKLIKTIEAIDKREYVAQGPDGDCPAPKFTARVEYLLNNGWRLVSSHSQMRYTTDATGCFIYSWAYLENKKGADGEKALAALGYSTETTPDLGK